MEEHKYLDDLKEIRQMMRRSTQFLSLSGLSGVLAGVYALIGAGSAFKILEAHHLQKSYVILESYTFKKLIAIALGVLIASIVTAYLFSAYKAKRNGETLVNTTSKRA
ncbi:MAG: hypothetical protein ACFNYA_09905, partial [Capnocytophaga granulosa]